ncbi:MAG: N-formylglutamate amidohydrolase, partial [Myxococcales bacterium]|nr:N-formylglutamate amidohydrolase [Myxococcales bacterium]
EAFFFVNTDIGAPECAAEVARRLGGGALILRSRIPRTFIDCNRVAQGVAGVVVDGLTPATPAYIDDPEDRALLGEGHRRYHELVSRAYEAICGAGGLALQLHSYAPRSVEIDRIDADIVKNLRWAYTPEVYARWQRRPDVDVICEAMEGPSPAPQALVAAVIDAYRALGLEVGASATYRLHPATMGYHYALRYPQRVLCVEVSRDLVADPFVPFGPSPISAGKIARMAAPLADALAVALDGAAAG